MPRKPKPKKMTIKALTSWLERIGGPYSQSYAGEVRHLRSTSIVQDDRLQRAIDRWNRRRRPPRVLPKAVATTAFTTSPTTSPVPRTLAAPVGSDNQSVLAPDKSTTLTGVATNVNGMWYSNNPSTILFGGGYQSR